MHSESPLHSILNKPYGNWILFALIIGAIVGWLFLGAIVFLLMIGKDANDAGLLTLYQYWYHYGGLPEISDKLEWSALIALVGLFFPFALLIAPGAVSKEKLHGAARFASYSEIKKAGLLGDKGIIVGRYAGKYLMFGGQQHAIISAPTRSGKGVGIVIPNLLNWSDSIVVLDIKQENWDITSGFRKRHGQACYLFNPAATDYRTHRYNPLAYLSEDPNFRIDDVQKIANMLFPDEEGTDVIWTATPRSLFMGIVLMLAETPEKPLTLGQVVRETLVDGDGSQYFINMMNQRAQAGKPYSGACVRSLNSYTSIAAPNTRAGVITSFRSRLELWMNPLVDAATSANDFDLRDVRKKRMSVYLGVTPDNLERMAPLLNLFFQQLIDLNTRELPGQNKALKYTCLLLMDEFTSIGEISVLSKGISYVAGYNLRMLPIIQSPSQLVEVYGEEAAKTFTTNHALNIIFPPKASETETAKDISEWLGNKTVKSVSKSRSTQIFKTDNNTNSTSEQSRALMLPQEITSLGGDKELVVLENVRPIIAQKVVYFRDHVFIDRLKDVSKSLRALGKKKPTRDQLDDAVIGGELAAKVPLIDLVQHQKIVEESDAAISRMMAANPGGGQVTKIDFSSIPKPDPQETNEDVLKAYADELCRAMGMNV